MKSSKVLIVTWVAAMGLITYRSFHSGQGMPAPRSLFAANVVWTILTLVGLANVEFANVLGVGTLTGLLVTNSSILGAATQSVGKASGVPTPASGAASAIGGVTAGVSNPLARQQGGQTS